MEDTLKYDEMNQRIEEPKQKTFDWQNWLQLWFVSSRSLRSN